jgi:hypothetical protein
MESVLKLLQRTEGAAETMKVDPKKLLSEIKDVSRLLAYNECWFQFECDSDLIDACIYQREELQARYRYLLSLAKEAGVSNTTS